MHGRRIALHHYGRTGSHLLRPSELSLQSGICKHKPHTTVVAQQALRGGVRLVFCERGYVDLGLLFSAVACERHPGARTQCGQSPLHHSILPANKLCSLSLLNQRLQVQYIPGSFSVFPSTLSLDPNHIWHEPSSESFLSLTSSLYFTPSSLYQM